MPSESQSNRRQFERFELGLNAVVVDLATTDPNAARIRGRAVDLSRGGVCISLPKMLHPGSSTLVVIDAKAKRIVEAAVVRTVRYESGAGHLTGFQFTPKPMEPKVVALLAKLRGSTTA